MVVCTHIRQQNNFINQKHKTSFGARLLYNVNLRKIMSSSSDIFIPAKVSELSYFSKEDNDIISTIARHWNDSTEYAECIVDSFKSRLREARFLIVEVLNDNLSFIDKLKSIIQLETDSSVSKKLYMQASFLQASPDIINRVDSIKGSGEVAVYAGVKEALKNGYPYFFVESANDGFYQKIGFNQSVNASTDGIFALSQNKYKNFINRVEKKYNIVSK